MDYDPKFYQITVALPLDELSANQNDTKVLDLAGIEIQTAAHDMADKQYCRPTLYQLFQPMIAFLQMV